MHLNLANKTYINFNRALKSITVFHGNIAKKMLLIFICTAISNFAFAQETRDLYINTYTWSWLNNNNGLTTNVNEKPVLHRKAKWYDERFRGALTDEQKNGDTFDYEGGGKSTTTLDGNVALQDTHEYVDTIYMHKGSSITLDIPYYAVYNNGGLLDIATSHYQRWYDYRTDGNFYCNFTKDGSQIYDLLTPANTWYAFDGTTMYDSRKAHRFQNGYVQISSGITVDSPDNLFDLSFYYPTDEEFEEIEGGSFIKTDNDYYVIACDVSIFNDTYKEYFFGGYPFGLDDTQLQEGDFYEPTLSGRSVFYIIGVEDEETTRPEMFKNYWNILSSEYQGGANNTDAKYLEEYDIIYPSRRTSCHTNELVALSKDANAYAIPVEGDDSDILNLSFENNEAGLALTNQTLEGQNRVIQFYKEDAGSGNPWKIEDGLTSTIIVTKEVQGVTYNIARFNLTFKEKATPLTLVQVNNIGTNEDFWWNNMRYRSPEYIQENYDVLSSLRFDFTTNSSEVLKATEEEVTNARNNWETLFPEDGNGQQAFYPFPINWGSTSYAFYDGSNQIDVKETYCGDEGKDVIHVYTRYGMYSLTNEYIGLGDRSYIDSRPSDKPSLTDDYWFYVDASDRPGKVAELTFREDLCSGSEIVGTALIKSAGSYYYEDNVLHRNDDAGVLLTIMGVKTNETTGEEIHVPIYSQASSQIQITTAISGDIDEDGIGSDLTGKGENTNEWFQLYFSFLNETNEDYDYYTLKVDNYCASTDGGDYYFDDVILYLLHPRIDVEQTLLCCSDDNERSRMRLDVDYTTIMSRLGYDYIDFLSETPDDELQDESLDFIVINEAKYNNYIAENPDGISNETLLKTEAIKSSIVTFWDSINDSETYQPTLNFNPYYYSNKKYDEEDVGGNTPTNYTGEGAFYYRDNSEYGYCLSIDCYTDMVAYTPYLIILEPHTLSSGDDKLEEFAELIGTSCAIEAEYYLSATTVLKVNGEIVDPTLTYCANQTVNLSAYVQYESEDGSMTPVSEEVYFDWFFGDEETFKTPALDESGGELFGGTTLQHALNEFRAYYPTSTELSSIGTPATGEFTQNDYNIIEYYINKARSNELNSSLVLYKTHLDIRILTDGLSLICQPIPIEIFDEEGQALEVCFGYVPLTLQASGEAPLLNLGFTDVEYPNEELIPSLRLGLNQILSSTLSASNTNPSRISINLRDAKYIDDDETSVDHLGKVEDNSYLYLIETNDPKYLEILQDSTFSFSSYPIGRIETLNAIDASLAENNEESNLMQIYFYGEDSEESIDEYYKAFEAKEGYYYIFNINFEEKNSLDESIETPCQGSFPLEIIVVPEYLVWKGDASSNWNRDENWLRADKEDLHKTSLDDPYLTNGDNGTSSGFVPMLFSKVIIPKDATSELYMAGFKDSDGIYKWEEDEETSPINITQDATPNIMYDLMLYEDAETGALETKRFRVNLCDEIHFETSAKMLHPELLIYNRAWTDVEIEQGPWRLKSLPLKDVVSGDWYTKKSIGRETQEYFTDITFDLDSCDRLSPMVYQRSWEGSNNKIVYTSIEDNKPSYASTGWSSVYNDVTTNYQAGEGFSIKASNGKEDKLMFRFPKADTSYDYQGSDGSLSSDEILREDSGKLLISDLTNRLDPDLDADGVYTGEDVTANLTLSSSGYYIIGNPFTANMSMKEFLDKNPQFLAYYLEEENGPIVGTSDGTSWGTEDCLIEPYSAFFVTTNQDDITPTADEEVKVTFSKDMQTLDDEVEPLKKQIHFAIRAEGENGITSASVLYEDKASDDYSITEDAIILEDASWQKDGMPLVYTVSSDRAVSVNKLKSLTVIPLGVYVSSDSPYTLSFYGVDNFDSPSLYDAYANTNTPLSEGYTLNMEGSTHGRYFIRSNGPSSTGIKEVEEALSDIIAYSPTKGTIIVSAEEGIENIEVYSLGGMLLSKANVSGNISCLIDGIESGIAIVRARTSVGTFVKKIRVR